MHWCIGKWSIKFHVYQCMMRICLWLGYSIPVSSSINQCFWLSFIQMSRTDHKYHFFPVIARMKTLKYQSIYFKHIMLCSNIYVYKHYYINILSAQRWHKGFQFNKIEIKIASEILLRWFWPVNWRLVS